MAKKFSNLLLTFLGTSSIRIVTSIWLTLCICNGLVYADSVNYKQLGPYIIPIKSENISIEEENLEVTMCDEWSRIKACFIMRNNGDLQDVQMGLPQVVLCDERYRLYSRSFDPVKKEGIWDIVITIDGKVVPYKVSQGVREDSNREEAFFRTEEGTLIRIPVDIGGTESLDEENGTAILNWLTWGMQFRQGQKREILVAYSVGNINYKGHLKILYLLETARLWQNGIIKKLNITADFGPGLGISLLKKEKIQLAGGFLKKCFFNGSHFVEYCRYEVTDANPSGWHLEKGKMKWSLRDFRPENLSIVARSIVPLFCSSVLDDRLEYGPQMANDSNLGTAWVPANPTGEYITIPPCPREDILGPFRTGWCSMKNHKLKGLRIFSGCGRSPELFAATNRPKTIEIWKTRKTLKDIYGWQYIEVPKEMQDTLSLNNYMLLASVPEFVSLKIIDVYPGSRSNTTYLTEVEPVFE